MRELGLPHIDTFSVPPPVSETGMVTWRDGFREQALGVLTREVDAMRGELGEPVAYREGVGADGMNYGLVYWPKSAAL